MSLVERDAELEIFEEALAACSAGTGAALLVSGPVGVGKTELLQAFARRATDAGATVLWATASHAERSMALALLGQLLSSARLPAEHNDRLSRLVNSGASTPGSEGGQALPAAFLRDLTTMLLELAERTPVLLAVDDAHVADEASLNCLLYLLRRSARSRLLVVLNEAVQPRRPVHGFLADLISQPHVRQIWLRPLSTCGVAQVLEDQLDIGEDASLTHAFHHISGGSPMLLAALVREHRAAETSKPEAPVVGDLFAQAVLTCLHRSDPGVLELARVLAVLDEPATPQLLASLLDVDTAAVQRALDTAGEAGLLDGVRFRHPRAARAVLDGLTTEDRTAIHVRAASLLYRSGAPAMAVARQAIAGHYTGDPWSSSVLRAAADHALERNDTALALDCLHLAERGAADEGELLRIKSAMLRVQWRIDPANSERLVDDLLDGVRRGVLPIRQSLQVASSLLWYGRTEEAVEVLDRIDEDAAASPAGAGLTMYGSRSFLALTCPGLLDHSTVQKPPPPRAALLGAAASPFTAEIAEIAAGLFNPAKADEATSAAERLLQVLRLDDETVGVLIMALGILITAESYEIAAARCDALLAYAGERGVPTWTAIFSALRGAISLRCGDLAEAERLARTALRLLPPRSFGIFIGMPLSVLVFCATRAGRYEEAIEYLGVQVPNTLFQTTFGLHYLRARGHLYLAVGNHRTAVADFETCRDLMQRWSLDVPGLVPWRIDLAEAYLAAGDPDRARELAQDQIERLGPQNRRTLAHSVRVLAACTPAGEAVDLLGRPAEFTAPLPEATEPALVGDDDVEELSEAERRVAILAAAGHTNRQIALQLHVTASTVEQHLTRVYRKLRVSRRSDLPSSLSAP
ncbi:ATP-binding protein [Dactylosporangium matsuzakiense]|uniref:Transcriptional regulator n=1 Tax=Dactylosporangium matsuzakiense TaxID=53360 RepID=A0A9W6KMC9_9ACTN|nr:LuxR family transcriptional regulator [Dactylosporangium matsuzakiense]UWZ45918.1 AAA family ATPase [Dactylosporangium matsuzakiense]GLL02916.1 transcriptional regulator [Dactylosporangium matsuzakiense]